MSEDWRSLLKDALEDDSKLDDIPEDVLNEAIKKANPYGQIIPAEKSYINVSLINLRDEYFRKLHMTSLVAFLYQLSDEYEPADMEFTPSQLDDMKEADIEKYNKEHAENRKKIIKQFLNRNFNYNPYFHIDAAQTGNSSDPERQPKEKMLTRETPTSESLKEYTNNFNIQTAKELYQQTVELRDNLKKANNLINDLSENFMQLGIFGNEVSEKITTLAGDNVETLKKLSELQAGCAGLVNAASEISSIRDIMDKRAYHISQLAKRQDAIRKKCEIDVRAAYEADPPKNVFFNWDRFLTNNYEEIREATMHLYHTKPDLEYAILYHDHFDSSESAKDYRKRWESKFTTGVHEIENGNWTLLGPFKENRDRIDFYNKNTEILKLMFEQMEKDHEIGKQLLKDKISKKKRRNIREVGPDDKGLEAYKSTMSNIEALGAKEVLTREDKEKMAELQKEADKEKESLEVPEDAIQVDVFTSDSKGGFKKDKIYTKAEAPKFMEENIESHKQQLIGAGDTNSVAKEKNKAKQIESKPKK